MYATKICRICKEPFQPKSSRQLDCNKEIKCICKVCGSEFVGVCSNNIGNNTCSRPCKIKYAHNNSVNSHNRLNKICSLCGKVFHPRNNTQSICDEVHYRVCVICGTKFILDTTKNKADWPKTCSKDCKYSLLHQTVRDRYGYDNISQVPEFQQAARDSYFEKTGYHHPMQNPEVVKKMFGTYQSRTGYLHPVHNPEVRSRIATTGKKSALESRISNLLNEYGIAYEIQYTISDDNQSHCYDFHIPEYKLLIDADGLFYHGYLDDPDGKHINDYYDETRLALLPEGYTFHVIVEGNEEQSLKWLIHFFKETNAGIVEYETELFKWCRSIGFPYPEYDTSRLNKSYQKLCSMTISSYNPASRVGDCIIKHYHKSIWNATVNNYPSPLEAWNNDKLLKSVIANRLIYKNEVDPSKVLTGFNVSKICPRVSIFNPVLSKYLVTRYLSDCKVIVDPFSGFSGRMLGVCATGKKYVGSDLNENAVEESNRIIRHFDLDATVSVCDVDDTQLSGDGLITCPPYGNKEHYNNETKIRTCDEWIDIVLSNISCKTYVFVVDITHKYEDNVVETIRSTSHFNNCVEQVIVISK